MAEQRGKAAAETFVLEIPAEPVSIRAARLFAASVARHFDVAEDVIEDVKITVSEACTNAVKAHAEAEVSAPMIVRATVSESAILYEIIDAGRGFVPTTQEEGPTPPQGLFEGSLGLVLMRSLFDDVQIVPNDDRGMTVRFRCPIGAGILEEA